MNTVIQILIYLLTLVWWVIVIQAVLSWLIAFNVINTQNNFVRQVYSTLDRLTEPLYRPIRKVMPDFGALDLSPMVVIVILAVLAALIVPKVLGRPDEARAVAARQDIATIMQSLKLYRLDNGRYPTAAQGLDALARKPTQPYLY